jgi:hypothetical protein
LNATQRFERDWVKPKEGRTLIVGSRLFSQRDDRRKRYADAIGIDMEDGDGVDIVLDMEEQPPEWLGKFAHIECLSVIEHSRRPWLMAVNLEELLEPDGTIYVSVPFVWRLHQYPVDNWRISPNGLRVLFKGIKWDAIRIASDRKLMPEDVKKVPSIESRDGTYLLRCETLGFGRKRA